MESICAVILLGALQPGPLALPRAAGAFNAMTRGQGRHALRVVEDACKYTLLCLSTFF